MDDATKIRIEVELDRELVELAAGAGLDLNEVTGQALQRALGARQLDTVPRYAARRERLRKKVQREIAWYNAHVEKHGLFADEWRRF
jgi:post-segregation antitoxin (ccd killing protein)